MTSTFTPAVAAGLPASSVGNESTPVDSVGNQPTDTETPTDVQTRTETPATETDTETAATETTTPKAPTSKSTATEETATSVVTTEPGETPQVSVSENAAPRVKKSAALAIIDQINASDSPHLERAGQRVNGTLSAYRGPVRVSDPKLFTDDGIAIRALMRLVDSEYSNDTRRAAELIYEADNESARTTVADARRLFDQYESELDRGTRQSAESQLAVAEQALERANRWDAEATEEATEGREYYHARATAIPHLRTAHRHAQMVLDAIDRNETTSVTIEQRADPVRLGNESLSYPLYGNVTGGDLTTDTRVSISVNGTQVKTVNTTAVSTAAGQNRSYNTSIELEERINRIEVSTLEDSGPSAVLRLDGDGLPDTYETDVTGTDPLDPNSDAASTAANESTNETVDGAEDFDGDGLSAVRERELGTDPLANDSDDDGLTDAVEVFLTQTDPLVADTDSDGTPDEAEDPDEDGLDNGDEVANGTHPRVADSDRDDLLDGEEIEEYGTNATDPDTDDDGLDDGAEIRLGTDPLVADTDGDGVLDGNETFETETENSSLGVSLELTGEGDVANDTTIAPQDDPMFDTDRVDNMSQSPVVELTADQEFDSANVTMEYDDTGLENESQEVAIFTYDPEAGIFVPLNSTVDPANDTVTAQTEHFSTFAVYNIENWASTYDAKEPVRDTDDDGVTPVDVVMLMDVSGSMKSQDPDRLAKDAAQRFTSGLLDRDRAAVIEFDNFGRVQQPLTSNFTAVNQSIRNLEYEGGNGGTDFASIGAANEHFAERSSPDRGKITIFLTDGRSIHDDGAEKAAVAAENNITIYAIGFGGASRSQLAPIAEQTGGNVSLVDSAADLPEVFSRVAENTTTINDTDGDGLSDERETSGIVLGGPDGEVVRTDPTSNDTDGDGLSDGREVGEFKSVSFTFNGEEYEGSYFDYTANPTTPDTDSDGLSDGAEVAFETDPLRGNPDNDQFSDRYDPQPYIENRPPSLNITLDEQGALVLRSYMAFVSVSDESDIQRLEINYTGGTTNVYHPEKSEVTAVVPGPLNSPSLYIEAVDEHGNAHPVNIQMENESTVVSAGISLAALPRKASLSRTTVQGISKTPLGILVTASLGYAINEEVGDEQRRIAQSPLSPTPEVRTYENNGQEVSLNRGFVEEQDGYYRGYGWEYIQATSELTRDDIGRILEDGERVTSGEVTYVIGDGVVPEEEAILAIIGGTLMTAESVDRAVEHDSSNSNCESTDFVVETENKRNSGPDNPEHTIRDEKPINDLETLDDIIKNPDRILDFGPQRYLFRTFENGRTAVIVLHKNFNPVFSEVVYELITQLTDDGKLYDSLEDAVDDIKENEQEEEPSNDITC
ncbi:VWA domain-containing protein [Halomicrobium sp. IBSBa]|uniref:VWA domain-containing protein n=1 Tax=Halomicrobium sp. IBSBa TaxID=2778916 RepID=UPI001ABF9D94|nr:VWA domain-containing protein [Halomicrobium sp. IBSBa]MBO4249196.1 VWA domain-containing protein [Halomicrobium sp. IBSBa]